MTLQNLPIAARTLLRRPRVPLFILLVLALGIGLSAAMFSVLDGVMLRGLPFPDGDRIVTLHTHGTVGRPMPPEDFQFLEREQEVFTEVAAFRTYTAVVTRPGEGSKGLTATYVTGNLFPMLGAEPILGRNFSPADEDPASPSAAILSHRVWQSQFGGDPQVIGRSILLNRETMTVVGVMPPGFHFPVRQEAWAVLRWEGRPWSEAGVFGIGKLPPGLSARAATDRLQALMPALDAASPRDEARQFLAVDYVEAIAPSSIQTALRLLLFAVLGVLLLAATNVANLRLADALARRQDLVVRRALGGRTGQILRQLLTESLLLVGAATVAGLAVGWGLTRLAAVRFLEGSGLVRLFWIDVRFDARSALFAVVVALAVVVISGLVPALWALRRGEEQLVARRDDATRGGTLQLIRGLVAVQVALGFALLVASGWLVQSGAELLSQDPAFDPSRLGQTTINTYQANLETPESRGAFWEAVLPRLAQRPEIAGVTWTDSVLWRPARTAPIRLNPLVDPRDQRAPGDLPTAQIRRVRPGFFETLRWPIREGRTFLPADAATPEPDPLPAVVTTSFLRHSGDDSARRSVLGRRFEIAPAFEGQSPRFATIVGVVADAGLAPPGHWEEERMVFLPDSLTQGGGGFLLVRGRESGEPRHWLPAVDEEIARANPLVATLDATSYRQARAERVWVERRLAEIFSLFALAALVLSALGLFGVLSLSVEIRRRDLAIRSALGAQPANLRARLLFEAALSVVPGLLGGAGLLLLGHHALQAVLHGLEPWDPLLLAGVIGGLTLVLLLALAGPIHRAGRLDPARELAAE